MLHGDSTLVHPRRPRIASRALAKPAFTLVELTVTIAIIAVLISLVVVVGKAVYKSVGATRANTQIQAIAAAIDRYAEGWPAWENSLTGQKLSAKGWPQWSGWALFPNPPYSIVTGFNDVTGNVTDAWNVDLATTNGLKMNDECLTYSLLDAGSRGPSLRETDSTMFTSDASSNYPALPSSGSAVRRRLIDPWGHEYRFLWLARDNRTSSGYRAITSADSTQTANGPTGGPAFAKADAYVIESAGPDGKYGNVWSVLNSPPNPSNPTEQMNVNNAKDNLTIIHQ